MDSLDKKLLTALQRDASLTMDELAARVGLSRNACWRRVRRLEEEGVIARRVALLDPEKVGLGQTVFIHVRAERHDAAWLETFSRAVRELPQILGVYRTAGDTDYVIRARAPDVQGYDRLYRALIARVPLADVSASFVMEEIKDATELPLDHA